MPYRVCVYAICKNEEGFADRWMDSMEEADRVVVADTGSTDRTTEKLRARGAEVFAEAVRPWRFDEARNRSLAHVPGDADICVCTDLDEVFNKGWREKLEHAWTPDAGLARYFYNWRVKPDGSPDVQFVYEKIHARKDYRWVHPVHEVLAYSGRAEQKAVWAEGVVLSHYPDPSKSRGQYLPLLELSAKENPQDSSTVFWLGREYFFHKRYDDAIRTLEEHLKLPSARWEEERCASMRFLARCFMEKGDVPCARAWLYRAVAESPHLREPYWETAQAAYRWQEWPLVYGMACKGLECRRPSGSYLSEPEAWSGALHDLRAIACWHLGLYAQAERDAAAALAFHPDNARLRANFRVIHERLIDEV
ncbi:glycosyltransferase [Ethanoligenens harbinense]|uniref:Glycosyl transferase family 2 n=1 Tax=Ethanoligenens harbinense (strain DSM 18485 / JCM 12961 / CGMCC 1.5033 / YUAN-3) TaxID=663278 RepID=E6U346_ETHHY|nr:glycosyltransferase [Ethanoligenens harbinense]ADU27518.1 glycosyl transferase family 2 [Ethanoligenens harbinense YUAN-3]AVQ96570.1 glycosyl transferase family 2 [Ethanoligenens harbinense YUAN-3]AYF39231.1 glycosyl transferase family 2 [Ethanoligenens harbinense]AYF42055.1 glycosyl transferase family 2 [Ethanoligenens harbinense]QCN92810.1 glycosyltransferase [Ethanoligenens harbinense]